MSTPLIALILLCDVPETGFSRASRSFFEGLVEVRIEKEVLALVPEAGAWDTVRLRGAVGTAFPGVGSISVRWGGGSTSTRRGSGGEVSIHVGGDGGDRSLTLRMEAPGGDESLNVVQGAEGHLRLEVRRSGYSLKYEQVPGKCRLSVKAGRESFSGSGPSVAALLQRDPTGVRKYLLGSLESFFDRVPFIAFSAAPPGKTVIRLRDGSEVFGELEVEEVILVTAYGRLKIPRRDLVQIFLPGSELEGSPEAGSVPGRSGATTDTVVVTRRFAPRGRLELERIGLRTPYGRLQFEADDVLHVAFGEVEEAGDGK
jgi:hypothetical protein